LNRPWSNIGTAHRLIILDMCAKLFVNPTRGSKDMEGTWNTVIQCLILDCDLDLEPTLFKHRHCTTSHHTWHLCKVICTSHQGFKKYRAGTKVWQTDRRTDRRTAGRTDNAAKNNMSPYFMGGDIINKFSVHKHVQYCWTTKFHTYEFNDFTVYNPCKALAEKTVSINNKQTKQQKQYHATIHARFPFKY